MSTPNNIGEDYPCWITKKDFKKIYTEFDYNNDEDTKKAFSHFSNELKLAEEYRGSFEGKWEQWEKQFEAEIKDTDDTKAEIKLQHDRNILEQNIGEEWMNIPYKVESEGKTVDANAKDIWKFTLDYFIRKEKVLDELVDFKWDKWVYWTWILFSWITVETVTNNAPNKDGDWDVFNTEFNTVTIPKYHIWIKNINVWDFYPIGQGCATAKQLKRAMFREKLDYVDFVKRYWKKSAFKYVSLVRPVKQDRWWKEVSEDNQGEGAKNVYLFHYYNEITWDFWIIANRQHIIYQWKNLARNSKIPFDIAQHYKNRKSIFGYAIPYKTRPFLRYMNNLFEVAYDKVYSASNPPVIVWNNWEIDDEIFLWWDSIQVLNTNWDVKDIQQLNVDWNIQGHQMALEMWSNAIIENTWINTAEYNKPLSWINPFVAWLQEQSKKAKLLLWQVMQDIALGSALTKMLENLMDWWPSLYGELIEKSVQWDEIADVKYSWIKIKWKRLKKVKSRKWELISFETEEAPGEEDWFDFTPWLFMDKDWNRKEMSIYVTTPSTQTLLEALRKDDFTQYLQNLQTMKVIFPEKPLPISQEEILQVSASIYGYDAEDFESQSNKTKNAKEVANLLQILAESNPSNPQGNPQGALPTNQENVWASQQLPQG